jgi:hypothetical protein
MTSVRFVPADKRGDSGQNEEQPIRYAMPLRREMRRDRFRRTKSDECLTLRCIDRQSVLQPFLYGIDEMFTRFLDDPSVKKSTLTEFALKLPQIFLERR